jgi:RNA polymerase sigma-70 factor (ECF subfamily)
VSFPSIDLDGSPSSQSAEEWFANEVRPHEPILRSYLHGTFPALRDVDDLVQESFLRIWLAHTVNPIRLPKAFLFQVARHLALDLLRRDSASPICGVTDLAALTVLDEKPDAAENAFTREEMVLLAQAIHTLPLRCREIVVLRKIHCLPQKEIARRLGISEQTVQVQVLRGVQRIGDYLRRHGVQR